MEEFSDFQCPYCSRFSLETLPALYENQVANGEIMIIYYDFPLESIHPQAFAAANAARCAGEQSASSYWAMHDQLYQQTKEWSVVNPNPVFSEIAGDLKLDLEKFNTCLDELRYAEQVKSDIDFALSRGVRSTPSFFLNNQPLIGAQPVEVFNQAISSVLNGENVVDLNQPSQDPSPLQPPRVAPEQAHISTENVAFRVGDAKAPVTIVEFTDYQCPYCQRHALETYPLLFDNFIQTGIVQYIIKDLPLDSIHPNARSAAIAARCAGEQEAYMAMHDELFGSQERWAGLDAGTNEIFTSLAGGLGLDEAVFQTCLTENKFEDAIQADIDEALSLGANSTPYFFIDGYPIAGAQPIDLFTYAVELAQEGTLANAYVPPEPDLSDVFAIGNPNAPVVIIEYTDYQCPFCARHYQQTYNKIREKYIDNGQVYYIFKDFPLTNIHPQAVTAAEAARCAGEQDAQPEMHDRLFSTQNEWSGRSDAIDLFVNYASELNLDSESFQECLQSGVQEEAVYKDLEEGAQRGINGTPAFIINGYTMSGAQPYPIFEQAIDQFLADS